MMSYFILALSGILSAQKWTGSPPEYLPLVCNPQK